MTASSSMSHGDQLRVLKRFESEVEVLSKLSGKSQLQRVRRLGRVMVAVNWAIDELVSFKPSALVDIKSQADKIEKRLQQKGFKMSSGIGGEIPSYILSAIRQMRASGSSLPSTAGSRGSSQHEGARDTAAGSSQQEAARDGAEEGVLSRVVEKADFWPLDKYRAKFGSPERTVVHEGVEGVLVPWAADAKA